MFQFTTAPKEFYLIMLLLAGIFSSTSWPGLLCKNDLKLAIMNAWVPKKNKVIIMGIFASCINAGNILGFGYAGITIEVFGLDALTPIYMSGSTLFFCTLIFHIFCKHKPPITDGIINDNTNEPSVNKEVVGVKKLKIWKAWLLPGVTIYALAFGCIKAVSFAFGLWLPAYLDSLHISFVALINIMLDLGTAFGGVVVWYHKYFKQFFGLLLLKKSYYYSTITMDWYCNNGWYQFSPIF